MGVARKGRDRYPESLKCGVGGLLTTQALFDFAAQSANSIMEERNEDGEGSNGFVYGRGTEKVRLQDFGDAQLGNFYTKL